MEQREKPRILKGTRGFPAFIASSRVRRRKPQKVSEIVPSTWFACVPVEKLSKILLDQRV